jgi:hypothetical protein
MAGGLAPRQRALSPVPAGERAVRPPRRRSRVRGAYRRFREGTGARALAGPGRGC